MLIFRSLEELQSQPPKLSNPVLSTGFLDGLHLGHQSLLSELQEWAKAVEGQSCIVTFSKHPQYALCGSGPPVIHSLAHRLLLLERQGIEACLVLDFTRELASWSPEEFVERILQRGFNSQHLLLGFDSSIGHKRKGNFQYLKAHSDELDLHVRQAEAFVLNGQRISSTLVREAIFTGDLDRVETITGRPYAVLGTVFKGDQRGRELGFPTANLRVEIEASLPSGVYFAEVTSLDKSLNLNSHPALVNLGRRPTFKDIPREDSNGFPRFNPQYDQLEAHLLDYSGDLYDQRIELTFKKKHRDEVKFSGPEALIQQIKTDEAEFRAWLKN